MEQGDHRDVFILRCLLQNFRFLTFLRGRQYLCLTGYSRQVSIEPVLFDKAMQKENNTTCVMEMAAFGEMF